MAPENPLTHRDIAAVVGCDRSTVSLALSGSPKVAEATAKRVRKVAAELGYRPDPAISALARHRWARSKTSYRSTLAYLVEKSKGSYDNQVRHFKAARERALERGYELLKFDLSEYPNGAAASRVLYHRGITGLIVPAMPRDAEVDFRTLDVDKFAIVFCSLGWLQGPFHTVSADVFAGTRLCWREVCARGYRRIGAALFKHTPVAVDDHARLGASYAAQMELVRPEDRIPFHCADIGNQASFWSWYDQYRPDAIICFVHTVASWLSARKVRVPSDVALACLNVFPHMNLSGLSVQTDAVGRTAVDVLVAQLTESRRGIPSTQCMTLVEPHWVEGRTLPPTGRGPDAVSIGSDGTTNCRSVVTVA